MYLLVKGAEIEAGVVDDVHQSTFVSDWKSLIRKKFKSDVSCEGFFLSAVYNLFLYSKVLKTHFEIQTIPAQKLVCVNHFFSCPSLSLLWAINLIFAHSIVEKRQNCFDR